MILADTSVFSLALRRRPEQLSEVETRIVAGWSQLALEGDLVLIGPVRQEMLSGIRHQAQFVKLQQRLNDFPSFGVLDEDHDRAAEFFNTCRAKGLAAGPIDMIICAVAVKHDVHIMTTDPDFDRYARHIPIRLWPV